MSDVYIPPEIPDYIANFSDVIPVLWDRDNVIFPEDFEYSQVSESIRKSLKDLGILNPKINIQCYIASPEKLEKEETAAYNEDPCITIYPAARNVEEKRDQGADNLMKAEIGKLVEMIDPSTPKIVVVMGGDGDFRTLIGKLRAAGYIVLSIQPQDKEQEGKKDHSVMKKSLRRAGNYNANMEDIALGSMVKWRGPAVDKQKIHWLEALKRKHGVKEEEDWTEYLNDRFGVGYGVE